MEDQPQVQSQPPRRELKSLIGELESEMEQLKKEYPEASTIKDFRLIFDQESSQMNRAIFNDAPQEEVCRCTRRTIAALLEILSRC